MTSWLQKQGTELDNPEESVTSSYEQAILYRYVKKEKIKFLKNVMKRHQNP